MMAGVTWPKGRTLIHVLISGLLAQGLLFTCLYVALLHGAPAVLGAVIISMNPVVTAVLAAMFLGEGLTLDAGGCARARSACGAGRMRGPADDGRRTRRGGAAAVGVALQRRRRRCLPAEVLPRGGLPRDRRTAERRVRRPVVVLAALMPLTVTNPWKAAGAVAAVVLLNATLCMTMYVRAVNDYGAAAVAMLFAVIPAVAGLLSWLMLGQRPDIGIAVGLVVGAVACWLNARSRRRQDAAPPTASITRASSPARSGPAG